ncbi:MAG: hypothetical protein ABL921_12095, partial [Pirellula sp.]
MIPILHLRFRLCCKKSTRLLNNAFALTLAAAIVCLGVSGNAQVYDSFDTTRPQFQVWYSDTRAQLLPVTKTEPGVELIEVSNDNGSFAYLVYPIQPSAIIEDLTVSIRIRSPQNGIKVGFRIVFPRSTDPATHDPITEVVLGTPTDGGGRWSTSSLNHVVSLYESRVRFLRAKYGPNVDLRDAYVDGVILSVYSPRGTFKMQVDDLQVLGMIAPSYLVAEQVDVDGVVDRSEIPVKEQLRNLQASVPRWIQYQGESLDYLKSLGFNA